MAEVDTHSIYVGTDGTQYYGATYVLTEEEYEQVRTGYRCLKCMHAPQPDPFPEHCVEPYCRYEMKRYQLEHLGLNDRGRHRFGPTPIEDLEDQFAEEDEIANFQKRTGIWLPGRD